jgi:hypothetical protein
VDVAHKLYSAAIFSTGVIMKDDFTVKNRYSCEEWRNLSCVRE